MISPGTINDLPWLIDIAQECWAESKLALPPVDAAFMAESVRYILAHPTEGCLFVVEGKGFCVGLVSRYLHSPERFAVLPFLLIGKKYRGSYGIAKALVRAYHCWAEGMGLTRITAGGPSAKVDAFYRRLGYEPLGVQYLRCSKNLESFSSIR